MSLGNNFSCFPHENHSLENQFNLYSLLGLVIRAPLNNNHDLKPFEALFQDNQARSLKAELITKIHASIIIRKSERKFGPEKKNSNKFGSFFCNSHFSATFLSFM